MILYKYHKHGYDILEKHIKYTPLEKLMIIDLWKKDELKLSLAPFMLNEITEYLFCFFIIVRFLLTFKSSNK